MNQNATYFKTQAMNFCTHVNIKLVEFSQYQLSTKFHALPILF